MKNLLPFVLPLFVIACGPVGNESPNDDANEDQTPLAAPEAGEGIQLRMATTVTPGIESYGCQMFQVPEEGLFIHEEEVQFGPGGHHVLLYKTPYTSIPTTDENGVAVEATTTHDCSRGVTSRWQVDSIMGGSEVPGDLGMLRGLPEGVAVFVPGNSVLVMSVHYLNASPEPMEVDARMNLYTMAAEDVKMEAGLLYLDNHMLHVPAMGSSTARMRCPVPSNVSVVNLQSHMHARGVSFNASVMDQKNATEAALYETTKWFEPPIRWYDPLLQLTAGQTIEMRCAYKSTATRDTLYGPQSTDEMCQLIGPYFPRDERFEACANAAGESAATWVGEGSQDGAQTAECIKSGFVMAACVNASCPAIAEEVSAVARCRLANQDDSCATELEALAQARCTL